MYPERLFRCVVLFLLRPIDYSVVVPHWPLRVPLPIRCLLGFFLGHRYPLLAYVMTQFYIEGTGLHSESGDIPHPLVGVRHCSEEAFLFLHGLSPGDIVFARCLLFPRRGFLLFSFPRFPEARIWHRLPFFIGKGSVNLKRGEIPEMYGPAYVWICADGIMLFSGRSGLC